MFQEIGGTEILLIAIVALIVVGPKDLPVLLRKLGQLMAKLRGMASEFRSSFEEMARQSELDELRREVEAMRRGQWTDPAAQSTHADIAGTFNEIHQDLAQVGVDLNAPTHYQYAEPTPAEGAEGASAPAPAKKPRVRKAAGSKPSDGGAKPARAARTAAASAAPAKRAAAAKPAAKRKPKTEPKA